MPIVIGALGAVSGMCEKYAGKLNVTIRLKVIQKAALLGTAGLFQKVLAIQGLKCKDSFGTSRNLLLLLLLLMMMRMMMMMILKYELLWLERASKFAILLMIKSLSADIDFIIF